MIIQHISVKKLLIRDLPSLDPISLYLEDLGPGQGNVTITCYGKSWVSYWGAMGKETVAEFILSCGTDYLINCLSRGISNTQFSGDALVTLARRSILGQRRPSLVRGTNLDDQGDLSREEARELYDQSGDLGDCTALENCPHHLMDEIFGEEWWHVADQAKEDNPEYKYLEKIVQAMQEALRACRETEAVPA